MGAAHDESAFGSRATLVPFRTSDAPNPQAEKFAASFSSPQDIQRRATP